MTDTDFQASAERLAEHVSRNADALRDLMDGSSNIGETKRYLALARTAAQESELWLGRAMVAYAAPAPRTPDKGKREEA